MSKIICDVCGTTYAETASQCPICGSARNSSVQTAAGDHPAQAPENNASYNYVKGGRFSKSNVRKRNAGAPVQSARPTRSTAERRSAERAATQRERRPQKESSNTGLVIVVLLLLLAIIAVVIYIGVKFFGFPGFNNPTDPTPTGNSEPTSQTDDSGVDIPCTAIQLSNPIVELETAGKEWLLSAELTPRDTTDELIFTSSDENVAVVSESGVITAVGGGQAIITVTCGDQMAECRVVCSFDPIPTDPQTPTDPQDPTEPAIRLTLNFSFYVESTGKYDGSFSTLGQVWPAYLGDIPAEEITWSSDNPGVASVDANGNITMNAYGKTEIHAQYRDQVVTAIVRVNNPNPPATEPPATEPPAPPATEPPAPPATEPPASNTGYNMRVTVGNWASWKENGAEFSLNVGESAKLELVDADGVVMPINWSVRENLYCTANGDVITANSSGLAEIACNFEGVIYTIYVRVR